MTADPPPTPTLNLDRPQPLAADRTRLRPSARFTGRFLRETLRLAAGFLLLVACLQVGALLKARLGLLVPANVLGLALLLGLLRLGWVPLGWVESAADRLLFLLPALFVPIYVGAVSDGAFWASSRCLLLPILLVATAVTWVVIARVAGRVLKP